MDENLRIHSLSLRNFRNATYFTIDDIGRTTVFYGPNAVGKTSIIEAIQLMTELKSFRCTKSRQLIKWGNDYAQVEMELKSPSRLLSEKMTVGDGKRTYQVNGKKKSLSSMKGLLPAVVFSPDDLNLVKGSNTVRRNEIDSLGSQLSKSYYQAKKDYQTVIKQKNKALKDEVDGTLIDTLDEMLLKIGLQLMSYRGLILKKISPVFLQYYRLLSDEKETAELCYFPCWLEEGKTESPITYEFDKEDAYNNLKNSLAAARPIERKRCRSVVGPHADTLSFFLEGKNALHFASQGQQRSMVLAWKLSELAIIKDTLHQEPVLLLDDVMSELDEKRRAAFLSFLTDDTQTFITTTNLAYFADNFLKTAQVVTL